MSASPDYYALLTRAVAALEKNTAEARQDLYGRARKALVDQLRARGAVDAEFMREQRALAAATDQVEHAALREQCPAPEPSSRANRPILGRPSGTTFFRSDRFLAALSGLVIVTGVGVLLWQFRPRQERKPPSIERQFYDATLDYKLGEYKNAYDTMYTLAKTGDANAQFNLAFLYAWRRGVPNDPAGVLNWYHCAAERGDEAAQFNVGVILLGNSAGLQRDRVTDDRQLAGHPRDTNKLDAEGLYWVKRSAAQGYPEAQYHLATFRRKNREPVPLD
jgi:TPR repeat protein